MLFCYTILWIASLRHDGRWRLWNVRFFCDRVPEWCVYARLISPTHADGYFRSIYPATFRHFLTFIDTRIIVLREKCRFTLLSQESWYSANESLLKCDFFWPRVIVYTFAYRSKIVLFPYLFYGTEEIWFYFIGIYRTLCTVSTYVIYIT